MAMLQNALGIFTNSGRAWQRIRNEKNSLLKIYWAQVPLLALIPAICAYFGVTYQGWSIGSGAVVKLTPESALLLCVCAYFAELIAIYILGRYINWMGKTFGAEGEAHQRRHEGTALAVYSAMPMMLAGAVLLWPQLWLVAGVFIVAACYSTYLIYEGIPILMNIPKERAFVFASSVMTVGLVLAVVVMVTTVIVWSSGMGPVYVN